MPSPLPEKIGKYVIDSVLGRGGMGEVYKAHDPALGRYVALKIMRGPSLDDEQARERFIREAQAAGGLRHPNIVTVYDLGEVDGQLFIAMELIGGQDLEKIIKDKAPLLVEDRLNIMIQVSEGVSYAHKHQIVHRDLKPSNIRIDEEGVVKLMDFGIAKMESSNMTASGTVMGTPFYMSPEQVRGLRVDTRSDIFALGAILYEVFAYQKAFPGEMTAAFFKIVHEQPIPLSEFLEIPSEPLQAIVNICLEKDKNRRLQTAGELAEMLRDVQRGYREMNAATMLGVKAQTINSEAPQFHVAPAPAAVATQAKLRPLTSTGHALPPSPPTVRPVAPTEVPVPPAPKPDPDTTYDPTQIVDRHAPPVPYPAASVPVAPPALSMPQAKSGSGLKMVVILFLLFLFLAGAGGGIYYYLHSQGGAGKEGYEGKVSQAKSLYQSGKYQDAIDIYDDILKKNPNDANLHFLKGAAKQKLAKPQEALLEYQTSVGLDPQMDKAWQQIGFIMADRMDYGNAENAFQHAVDINPKSGANWDGLAQTYLIQQKPAKAEEAYGKLLEIEPSNLSAHYNLGMIRLEKKDYAGAKKSFQKTIELNPNYAEAHNNLGFVYLNEGEYDPSIVENEKALEIKPNLASAHYQLSVAYEQKHDLARAADHLRKYMELKGDNDPALLKKLKELGG